jgi:hypothetical protein
LRAIRFAACASQGFAARSGNLARSRQYLCRRKPVSGANSSGAHRAKPNKDSANDAPSSGPQNSYGRNPFSRLLGFGLRGFRRESRRIPTTSSCLPTGREAVLPLSGKDSPRDRCGAEQPFLSTLPTRASFAKATTQGQKALRAKALEWRRRFLKHRANRQNAGETPAPRRARVLIQSVGLRSPRHAKC